MFFFKFFPKYTKDLILSEIKEGAEFDELKFPLRSMQQYKIFQFRSAKNREAAGLGVSLSTTTAYKIAYFEYLERKALIDYGVSKGFDSTNGLALHKFKLLASLSAKAELFERDSFLLHWYSSTPFINIDSKNIPQNIIPVLDELKEIGFETRFGKTFLGEQETIVATLIDSNSRGFVLGLSSGRGAYRDIEKAFLEANINLFFGGYGKSKQDLLAEIQLLGISSLGAHRALWLYLKKLPDWFYGNVKIIPVYEKNTIQVEEVLLTKKPFPVVGVRSSDILNLEVGEPSGTTIDVLRRRVKADKSDVIKIWNWPHPIP